MPRNRKPDYDLVYNGLDRFKDDCLRQDGSLFASGKAIWTEDNVRDLHRRFNESPQMQGGVSFEDKLAKQMDGASDESLQLFAEVLWLHFSGVSNVGGDKKREHVNRLLGWMKHPESLPSELGQALEHGMASGGMGFNMLRAQCLWFLIDFVKGWKSLPDEEVSNLLADPWAFKAFLWGLPITSAAVQRNALLHLIHPDSFDDIYSDKNKKDIVSEFKSVIPSEIIDIDKQIACARDHVKSTWPEPDDDSRYWCPFYWGGVRELWDSSAVKDPEPVPSYGDTAPIRRVWIYSPGTRSRDWDRQREAGIMAIGWDRMGDLSRFATKEDVEAEVDSLYGSPDKNPSNTKRAMVDMRFRVQPGDLVIAKKGRMTLLGAGTVRKGYRFETGEEFPHVFDVEWSVSGEWDTEEMGPLVLKALTDIGKYEGFPEKLLRKMGVDPGDISIKLLPDDEVINVELAYPPYSMKDALSELFVNEEELVAMVDLLRYRKNLVLTGPPGTGKTYLAKRLGYLLAEERSAERICPVQFHQSMSYEDFVQGYRPSGDGFKRVDGPFVRFCKRAAQDDAPHILLIDEINRGNLSKILGELMLLIESDKRSKEWATHLTYADGEDDPFWVPDNVYIIGTMNTADRSLALVDYALRRRFAFQSVAPALGHEGFHRHMESRGMSQAAVECIVTAVLELNECITGDPNLGDGFCIGHSYFCGLDGSSQGLRRLIKTELAPLLREYWFDDPGRAAQEIRDLENAV